MTRTDTGLANVTVIGAGLIGRSWAVVFAAAGRKVRLQDADAAKLDEAMAWFDRSLPDLATAGLVSSVEETRAQITAAPALETALEGTDWVQECTLEVLDVKRAVFARLDELSPEAAILASSSSGLSPSTFAAECVGRHRCLVAHPVNPPHLVPLVEIVGAPWTDPQVIERSMAFMGELGQAPIHVRREVPGFVLNRLQGALLDEAFRLVEGGYASPDDVDRCMVDGLAPRWSFIGPFETIDLNAGGGLAEYAERYGPMYFEMNNDRTPIRPWDPETVRQIAEARRSSLPEESLGERQAWRDRELMQVAARRKRQLAGERA